MGEEEEQRILVVHDVVNEIARQAIYTETHCLCHLCETFGFHLMLEDVWREVGTFAVNLGLYQSKSGALTSLIQ